HPHREVEPGEVFFLEAEVVVGARAAEPLDEEPLQPAPQIRRVAVAGIATRIRTPLSSRSRRTNNRTRARSWRARRPITTRRRSSVGSPNSSSFGKLSMSETTAL